MGEDVVLDSLLIVDCVSTLPSCPIGKSSDFKNSRLEVWMRLQKREKLLINVPGNR
jgi:hypothetical protein